MLNLLFLALSLFLVIKSADFSIKYAINLARILRLPNYVVGFLIVAVISILPETFIALDSSIKGIPSFGLGTLFGSNIADLTLVFALIVLFSVRGIKISSQILDCNQWFPLLLAVPIFVGFDGYYSRLEGVLLLATGVFFFWWTFRKNFSRAQPLNENVPNRPFRNILFLILSLAVLLLGSHLTVKYGVALADSVRINPILVGLLVVGLSTTLPELFFSLRAVRQKASGLALGDILGTVISDATIAVGLIAVIHPFSFPTRIIYLTAMFMVFTAVILFSFMRSGKILTKKEAFILLLLYLTYVLMEYRINQ
ncbi:MAG: hypothetical protein WC528_03510 [Patescibacteria group bacterium]